MLGYLGNPVGYYGNLEQISAREGMGTKMVLNETMDYSPFLSFSF